MKVFRRVPPAPRHVLLLLCSEFWTRARERRARLPGSKI